jgi:hypothetical protein
VGDKKDVSKFLSCLLPSCVFLEWIRYRIPVRIRHKLSRLVVNICSQNRYGHVSLKRGQF